MKSKNQKRFTIFLIRIRQQKRPFSRRQDRRQIGPIQPSTFVAEDRTLLISRRRIRRKHKLNRSIDIDFFFY